MEATEDQLPISEEDRTVIFKAEFRLANACMAELGFPPTTGPERYAQPAAPAYLSPTELRRGGYQYDFAADAAGSLTVVGADALDPTKGMSAAEAEEYSVASGGDPDEEGVSLRYPDGSVVSTSATGCQAEARAELYGSLLNYLRYDRQSSAMGEGGLAKRLGRDSTYERARAAWQSCVQKAGQRVDAGSDYGVHTLQRRQWIQVDKGGGPLTEAETSAMAEADADCQESSGLYEVRERLLPGARKAIAKRLGLEQSEINAFENAVLAKAKTVR